jgi:PucR C-terminal helix-turn-helix domain/GGDEF-like domain
MRDSQPDASLLAQERADLVERLRRRRSTLEDLMLASFRGADTDELGPKCEQREPASALLDCAFAAIEQGEAWSGPAPPAVTAHARRSARKGASLPTELSRYMRGYMAASDMFMAEAMSGQAPNGRLAVVLRQTLAATMSLFALLMVEITAVHTREQLSIARSSSRRRAETVRRLIDGDASAAAEIDYALSQKHVGLVAVGTDSVSIMQAVASQIGSSLLWAMPDEETVWAWMGGYRDPAESEIARALRQATTTTTRFAVGAQASGLAGFRLTHSQAQRSLAVALHRRQNVTLWAEVALEASALGDNMVSEWLMRLISPLDSVQRNTLSAYYQAGRNVAKASSVLGVVRNTVENRLRQIEQRLNYPINGHHTELELALRLDALGLPYPSNVDCELQIPE